MNERFYFWRPSLPVTGRTMSELVSLIEQHRSQSAFDFPTLLDDFCAADISRTGTTTERRCSKQHLVQHLGCGKASGQAGEVGSDNR
jgi:hypothetical protein